MKDQVLTLEFDGGSRGNPGPAAVGVVVRAEDQTPLITLGRFIGQATNNVAEYRALIAAMEQAKTLGAKRILIHGDSELIVRQMTGQYRVKSPDLKPLYDQAQELFHSFTQASIGHNRRHRNTLADRLANLAMDRRADVTEVDAEPANQSESEQPGAREMQAGDRAVCARCGCVLQVVKPSRVRPHQLKPFRCACGAEMSLG
ncbi:MAG: ribonuclease HI family protein [Phycisphaerales bacterium]|nr:ribonuclease HI family protein [Phycisphaerales bacterium]